MMKKNAKFSAAGMKGEMETFCLPKEYSLGRITVYVSSQRAPLVLDARGTVQVSKGAKLFFDASQAVCDDLRRIHLVPGRLLENGISFLEKNLDKMDFLELRAPQPKSLVISFCNQVRVDQLLPLGKLECLEHLNLSYTPLDEQEFSWTLQFPNLKTLLLAGSNVDDKSLKSVIVLQNLETLDLMGSKIGDPAIQGIWEMPKLRGLRLESCAISDKALANIGHCAQLSSLHLSDTRISDAGVEVIVSEAVRIGQNIHSLGLRSCRITDTSLVRLASLKGLALIDLFHTEVTPQGIAFFKKSLPGCRILIETEKARDSKQWQVDRPETNP